MGRINKPTVNLLWIHNMDLFKHPIYQAGGAPLLVSFDVFDTLLLRCVDSPEHVFDEVGYRAARTGIVPATLSPVLFRIARQEAERRARIKKPGGEVNLCAIYDEMALGDSSSLIELELAIESGLLFANPLLLPILRELAVRGTPVVLTSDMYLAHDDLIRLLTGSGIDPSLYRHLYVSNAYGCSKKDGGLFHCVMKDHPGIRPVDILHIGDDPLGDVMIPRSGGLRTIHYVPAPALRRLLEREQSVLGFSSSPSGLPLRRLVALAGREDTAETAFALEFGSLVVGPAVVEYCRWVVEECHRHGIHHIAPLMREAAVFAPLMREWIAHRGYDIKVTSVHASRQALMPLEFERLDAKLARHLLHSRPHLSWDRLLILAGGSLPEALAPLKGLSLEQLAGRCFPDGSSMLEQALSLFDNPALKGEAARRAQETGRLLRLYLEDQLGAQGKVALVDLGARGSTPTALAQLLPDGWKRSHIFLAYAVSDIAGSLAEGLHLHVFAGQDETGMTLGRILYRSPQILERILTGLSGTTLGYDMDDQGDCHPIIASPPSQGDERRLIDWIQAGIRRYATLSVKASSERTRAFPPSGVQALVPLAAALLRPTAQEAHVLGGLAYDQNDGVQGERVICDDAALETVRPLASLTDGPLLGLALGLRPATVPWPQGALTNLDPGIFQRPADLGGLTIGHGPACRALVSRLQAASITRFSVVGVGGDGGMGPDFIHHAREAGLEPMAYADLMAHLVAPPLFHGVPVHQMEELPELQGNGEPSALVLVTLGYTEKLAAMLKNRSAEQGYGPRLITLGRPDLERQ